MSEGRGSMVREANVIETTAGEFEIRESDEGVRRLYLTLLQEGRVAQARAEVFAPGSVRWPGEGVAVRVGHGAPAEFRSVPVRRPDGRVQLSARATAPIMDAVASGVRGASVEFFALQESRNRSGVREIQKALVDGVAIVKAPEYSQGRAEIRSRGRRRVWL